MKHKTTETVLSILLCTSFIALYVVAVFAMYYLISWLVKIGG